MLWCLMQKGSAGQGQAPPCNVTCSRLTWLWKSSMLLNKKFLDLSSCTSTAVTKILQGGDWHLTITFWTSLLGLQPYGRQQTGSCLVVWCCGHVIWSRGIALFFLLLLSLRFLSPAGHWKVYTFTKTIYSIGICYVFSYHSACPIQSKHGWRNYH